MTDKASIKEIFTSIQGEGPYIGYKQLFIRFCGCNLNCSYCDTEFLGGKCYTTSEVIAIINKNTDCHSVSLTGGEPLLHNEFLKQVLPYSNLPVYLETNATLPSSLKDVIDYIKFVSADIKLPSCTGLAPRWKEHDEFFNIASSKELFAKVVFDENITEEEIKESAKLCSKYNIELILQPRMGVNNLLISKDFIEKTLYAFLKHYKNVRLIPQVHKFLDIR